MEPVGPTGARDERKRSGSVRRFVVASRTAGLAIHQAVNAKADIDHRLAKTTELFALARGLRLFALGAFVFGSTGSGAHTNNLACDGGNPEMTLVIAPAVKMHDSARPGQRKYFFVAYNSQQ
jgi:hypothetical protein